MVSDEEKDMLEHEPEHKHKSKRFDTIKGYEAIFRGHQRKMVGNDTFDIAKYLKDDTTQYRVQDHIDFIETVVRLCKEETVRRSTMDIIYDIEELHLHKFGMCRYCGGWNDCVIGNWIHYTCVCINREEIENMTLSNLMDYVEDSLFMRTVKEDTHTFERFFPGESYFLEEIEKQLGGKEYCEGCFETMYSSELENHVCTHS